MVLFSFRSGFISIINSSSSSSLSLEFKTRVLNLKVALRYHLVQPRHFMDKETETYFLRNLPPIRQLVRKTARARSPFSWEPGQRFFCYTRMLLTGYYVVFSEIFVEVILSVRHYSGLWEYSHEQSKSHLLDLHFSMGIRQWSNR